eukprot:GHVT01077871.1.p1 GENE.GHVT01077871.1~~GHVT01077871.1.p1  ORF type:complete len:460 (-),score=69.51 GHVT01077871.1:1050-2429(-)
MAAPINSHRVFWYLSLAFVCVTALLAQTVVAGRKGPKLERLAVKQYTMSGSLNKKRGFQEGHVYFLAKKAAPGQVDADGKKVKYEAVAPGEGFMVGVDGAFSKVDIGRVEVTPVPTSDKKTSVAVGDTELFSTPGKYRANCHDVDLLVPNRTVLPVNQLFKYPGVYRKKSDKIFAIEAKLPTASILDMLKPASVTDVNGKVVEVSSEQSTLIRSADKMAKNLEMAKKKKVINKDTYKKYMAEVDDARSRALLNQRVVSDNILTSVEEKFLGGLSPKQKDEYLTKFSVKPEGRFEEEEKDSNTSPATPVKSSSKTSPETSSKTSPGTSSETSPGSAPKPAGKGKNVFNTAAEDDDDVDTEIHTSSPEPENDSLLAMGAGLTKKDTMMIGGALAAVFVGLAVGGLAGYFVKRRYKKKADNLEEAVKELVEERKAREHERKKLVGKLLVVNGLVAGRRSRDD